PPELGARVGELLKRRRVGLECGSAQRGKSGATTEDEALEQRVRGETVRAVDAGARALAGGVQTGNVSAPVEIGYDAADRVVGGGGDGNRLFRGGVSRLLERGHQGRIAVALDLAQVEPRTGTRIDGASDDVARRKFVDEA